MAEESDIPSEEVQKYLTEEYKKAHKKVLYLVQEHHGINEGFISFLLYLSSENLVKQSSWLTRLTVALLVASVGMIGLAIAQLVIFLS